MGICLQKAKVTCFNWVSLSYYDSVAFEQSWHKLQDPVNGPALLISWINWSQLLCSIEKAVWKLAQSGLSTAAKIYYYRIFYTSTFFSNGRISETKRRILNALVPKFSYRRGLSSPLSWKWPRPTLSSSFSLFLERRHFFGVFQVGQIGPLRFKTCPWDPYWKKFTRQAKLNVCHDKVCPLVWHPFRSHVIGPGGPMSPRLSSPT